jgi:hypothetical protein
MVTVPGSLGASLLKKVVQGDLNLNMALLVWLHPFFGQIAT